MPFLQIRHSPVLRPFLPSVSSQNQLQRPEFSDTIFLITWDDSSIHWTYQQLDGTREERSFERLTSR